MRSLLYLSFVFSIGALNSSNPDDSFPIYMRGMKWNEVEKQLKKDLSLTENYAPKLYSIDLYVNVRGHAGATRSDFNGTVTMDLTFKGSSDRIELHSNGLVIENAKLTNSLITGAPAGVSKITYSQERETITLHVNRTIDAEEKFILQISYRGIAKMYEYGLFESWDPKFNKSLDSNGPFILASNNFPTGARYWFPCFDEPAMRAAFELQVNHPSGLNVYSNTNVKKSMESNDGRTLSLFEQTGMLATYQLSLSVNHLSVQPLEIRLISSANSHGYYLYPHKEEDPFIGLIKSWHVDIPSFLERSLELVNNTTLTSPKDKLDIIVLEGTDLQSIQPGLVTLGRYSFWDMPNYKNLATEKRNLIQLAVGNSIWLERTEQQWFFEMLSDLLGNKTDIESEIHVPTDILYASLHERSLGEILAYSSSTKQYLTSKQNEMRSKRALHLFKLLAKFCPTSRNNIINYLKHEKGIFDLDHFIMSITKSCEDPGVAREFLKDFINQPGKAILNVKRANGTVTITQTRYHSTYFHRGLRDNKTRYTIPISYEIDGKQDLKVFRKNENSVTINVPDSSYFLIDHEFDHLYFAYYAEPLEAQRNYTNDERKKLNAAILKSIVAGFNIGYASYGEIFEHLKRYAETGVIAEDQDVRVIMINLRTHSHCGVGEYEEEYHNGYYDECDESEYSTFGFHYWVANYDDMFNNETAYWNGIIKSKDRQSLNIHCTTEWRNASLYQGFLETNFLGETTVVRPDLMSMLSRRSWDGYHWRDLHRFFFEHVANSTDHRFNLLAHSILNNVRRENAFEPYPDRDMKMDYLEKLREFVLRNPARAASMSTEIATRLEREYVNCELPKWHAASGRQREHRDKDVLREIIAARKSS